MKILADATLPNLTTLFKEPFVLTLYNRQDEIAALLPTHDILLCRSTLNVTAELLANSPIQCIATASSGIDHIDSNYLQQHHIALFDAKGCNAQAVADYVTSTLAFLYCKSKIPGYKAGIIGIGEVGSRVANRLVAAGFDVICYDPFKAKTNTLLTYRDLDELTKCDVICIHANLHDRSPYPSANLIGSDFLNQLKPKTIIINAARGGILNEKSLLNLTIPITYCTDVYNKEPAINAEIVKFATLCTPHIAGHTIEAKKAAVIRLSQQIHDYYGQTMPTSVEPKLEKDVILQATKPWQQCVLSLYNPLGDTQKLKAARDKKKSFLDLRQAHCRHDFAVYDTSTSNTQLKTLLGQ